MPTIVTSCNKTVYVLISRLLDSVVPVTLKASLQSRVRGMTAPPNDTPLVGPGTMPCAWRFVRSLPACVARPYVAIDQDGEFRFEWDFGPRRVLAIAVGRDGTLNLAGLYGHESSHGSYALGDELPPEVLAALRRVGALGDWVARTPPEPDTSQL